MITSSANAKVKQVVAWQQKAKERRRDKVFVAEGIKMFEEAPADSIREVYLSEELKQRLSYAAEGKEQADGGAVSYRLLEKLKQTGAETVSREVFAKMSDTQTPQGILTVLRQPEYTPAQLLKEKCPLFVVLESLQDPGNLGTIMRTAEGAGVTGVIMDSQTVDIFNPKVIRATMGSVYRVPFVYMQNMREIMTMLQKAGVHTYAAHLKGEKYYDSFSFCGPTAFLIGNEGNGLTKEAADMAESYLKIPMAGRLESLNASVAAALLMYEAARQRR